MNTGLSDIPAEAVQSMEHSSDAWDSRSNYYAILSQRQSRRYEDHEIPQPRSHQRNQEVTQMVRNHHMCNEKGFGIICVIAMLIGWLWCLHTFLAWNFIAG